MSQCTVARRVRTIWHRDIRVFPQFIVVRVVRYSMHVISKVYKLFLSRVSAITWVHWEKAHSHASSVNSIILSSWTNQTNLTKPVEFFTEWTKLAIMPILASEALLCKIKNSSNKTLTPLSIEPLDLWVLNSWTSDSKSNTTFWDNLVCAT